MFLLILGLDMLHKPINNLEKGLLENVLTTWSSMAKQWPHNDNAMVLYNGEVVATTVDSYPGGNMFILSKVLQWYGPLCNICFRATVFPLLVIVWSANVAGSVL